MPKKIKIPTQEDYKAYTGLHCSVLWKETPEHWRCPSCKRSKFELLSWGRSVGTNDIRKPHWKTALHKHHNHGYRVRWDELTTICVGCNSADGRIKRKLGLPKIWSFSTVELSQIVKIPSHGKSIIDFEIAEKLYSRKNWKIVDHKDVFKRTYWVELRHSSENILEFCISGTMKDVYAAGLVFCGRYDGCDLIGILSKTIVEDFWKIHDRSYLNKRVCEPTITSARVLKDGVVVIKGINSCGEEVCDFLGVKINLNELLMDVHSHRGVYTYQDKNDALVGNFT